MATVVLSLPKSMVFVALGSPSSKNSKAAKWGKVAAIAIVVIITIFASMWIRRKMAVATVCRSLNAILLDPRHHIAGLLQPCSRSIIPSTNMCTC